MPTRDLVCCTKAGRMLDLASELILQRQAFRHLTGRLHRNRSVARPVRERCSGLGYEDGIGTVHSASGLAKLASEINVL